MASPDPGEEVGRISDESSFYGDDEIKEALEEQVKELKSDEFLEVFRRYPDAMAARITSEASQNPVKEPQSSELPNRDKSRRQPGETVKNFLRRLPPLTTVGSDDLPWLWVDDPNFHDNTEQNLGQFTRNGYELINQFMEMKRRAETIDPGRPKQTITKILKSDRDAFVEGIKSIARDNGILSGKWMIFPSLEDLPRIWRKVCEGVIAGQLGPQAKVATAEFEGDPKLRLICVYTRNFEDEEDVRRVLLRLRDLGIVSKDDPRGIYYKADAYTYLDIKSDNPYSIRASLYSSRLMLNPKISKRRRGSADEVLDEKEPKEKKQLTLSQLMK